MTSNRLTITDFTAGGADVVYPAYPSSQQCSTPFISKYTTEIAALAEVGRWLSSTDSRTTMILPPEANIPFVREQDWIENIDPPSVIFSPNPLNLLKNSFSRDTRVATQYPFCHNSVLKRFFYDPEVCYHVNDKTRIHDISKAIPERELVKRRYVKSFVSKNLPCVLKKVTPSAGGDGIFICRTTDDIGKIDLFLGHDKACIVEEYIDDTEINVQFLLPQKEEEEVVPIGHAIKRVSAAGVYLGGRIDQSEKFSDLSPSLQGILLEACRNLRNLGVVGTVGFDVWMEKELIFDVNARLNGNTGWHGSKHAIASHFGHTLLKTVSILSKNPQDDIGALKAATKSGILAVSGGAILGNELKVYAAILGDDDDHLMSNEKYLTKRASISIR